VIVEPGGMLPRDVESEHPSAEFAHDGLTGEEMNAESIADVALVGIKLVESIIFAGHDADRQRAR